MSTKLTSFQAALPWPSLAANLTQLIFSIFFRGQHHRKAGKKRRVMGVRSAAMFLLICFLCERCFPNKRQIRMVKTNHKGIPVNIPLSTSLAFSAVQNVYASSHQVCNSKTPARPRNARCLTGRHHIHRKKHKKTGTVINGICNWQNIIYQDHIFITFGIACLHFLIILLWILNIC